MSHCCLGYPVQSICSQGIRAAYRKLFGCDVVLLHLAWTKNHLIIHWPTAENNLEPYCCSFGFWLYHLLRKNMDQLCLPNSMQTTWSKTNKGEICLSEKKLHTKGCRYIFFKCYFLSCGIKLFKKIQSWFQCSFVKFSHHILDSLIG